MRSVVETYAAIIIILMMFLLGMAFTTINLNVTQARKIYNDIKAEVQASNGAIVPDTDYYYYNSAKISEDNNHIYTLADSGYQYEFSVTRQSIINNNIESPDETYIYNDLYKISLKYEYYVPLFGKQVYPMTGFAY